MTGVASAADLCAGPSADRSMTILEVLAAAAGYLKDHVVDSPRLNAEHLLAHVLGMKRLDLYMEFDRSLGDTERGRLRSLVRDRGAGKPLQHLLGTAEFVGRSFLSDKRALIPRPETEQLVELFLGDPRSQRAGTRILDVGTGSGVIAITLALQLPQAVVRGTDVSCEALSLARENATRHSLNGKIVFEEADLFPPGDEIFDCVIANLPYIASGEIRALQREVRHDPLVALDGGPDGLWLVSRLIECAATRLAPDGLLSMEIGHQQAGRVVSRLAGRGYREIAVHKDYQNVERFVRASAPEPSEAGENFSDTALEKSYCFPCD
jgi:release factor glutamine methyltransferase